MKHRIQVLTLIERALRMLDEMSHSDCERDKAHEGGYCPLCSRHARAVHSLEKVHKLVMAESDLDTNKPNRLGSERGRKSSSQDSRLTGR